MIINSTTIPLPIENIDTDQIIPAEFLKQVDKTGYGKNLFYNWRYSEGYEDNSDFILNHPDRANAEVLIAGNNFGCGSSREHAAWAISDYGIKAIVSTQFADIFKGNAYNNGIIPIELDKKSVDQLMQAAAEDAGMKLIINLKSQTVKCLELNFEKKFDIHPFKKQCLIEGVDETDFLINLRSEIETFEKSRELI